MLPGGKFLYSYGTVGDNSDAARHDVEDRLRQRWRDHDLALAQDKVLFHDLLENWLRQVERTSKPATTSNYRTLVAKIRKNTSDKRHAHEISHGDLVAVLAAVEKESGAYQRNRCLMVLRMIFRMALGVGIVAKDATAMIKAVRTEPRERAILDETQAAQLLAAVQDDPWWYAALSILLKCGLRRAELLGLTWDAVSLRDSQIQIRQNLGMVRGKRILGTPKTAGSERTIPLGKSTVQALTRLRDHLAEQGITSAMVFPDKKGNPKDGNVFTKQFGSIIAKAGLPKVCVHALRSSSATIAMRNGMPLEVVQKQLGHASPVTLLTFYRKIGSAERKALATKMEELIPSALVEENDPEPEPTSKVVQFRRRTAAVV